MLVEMLKSKIHRARVTESDLGYEGSFTIDSEIMKKASILPYEAVEIYNVTNGSRIKTYAIEGEKGVFCANGAAAHKIKKGDIVIICAYALMGAEEAEMFMPKIIKCNGKEGMADKEC